MANRKRTSVLSDQTLPTSGTDRLVFEFPGEICIVSHDYGRPAPMPHATYIYIRMLSIISNSPKVQVVGSEVKLKFADE